jgi:hypothetical protein
LDGAYRLRHVVDVTHEHEHAREGQQKREKDRECWHEPVLSVGAVADLGQQCQRIHEAADEDAHRHACEPVFEERAQDARRKLRARKLEYQDRDREDHAGKRQKR